MRWLRLPAILAQAVFSVGCRSVQGAELSALQALVELEETPMGFGLAGRLAELLVKEGDTVEEGAVSARLDDGLEKSSRSVRQREAEVAKQQAGAVRAGARSVEVRSLAARIEAAKATEQLRQKQTARERALVERGAVAVRFGPPNRLQRREHGVGARRRAILTSLRFTKELV